MTLTLTQHRVLARLSDQQSRTGYDLEAVPAVLAMLHDDGRILTNDVGPLMARMWHITPDGLAALEAVV